MAHVHHRAFAADRNGALIAAIDGAELLVWSGAELQPIWKRFADVAWVDVGVSEDAVWTLDLDGVVQQRRRADGELLHTWPLLRGAGARISVLGRRVAAASADEVAWIVEGEAKARVEVAGCRALAWSADGTKLAIAEAVGALTVVDTVSATALGRVTVGGPPADVDWCLDGYWYVTVGRRMRPVRADGGAVAPPRATRAEQVRMVTDVAEGGLLAMLVGPRDVEFTTLDLSVALGAVSVGRDIVGIAAGPRGEVYLGLMHGDVQRVDLYTGSSDAALPHDGRARVLWPSDVRIDTALVRGQLVRRRVGSAAIATALNPDLPALSVWWTAAAWMFGGAFVLIVCTLMFWGILRYRGVW